MHLSRQAWWRHQMKSFSALLAFCVGNSTVTVDSPHKGQWRGALMFSLICTSINSWANNGDAGELKRHRAHYDVSAMNPGGVYWCTLVPLGGHVSYFAITKATFDSWSHNRDNAYIYFRRKIYYQINRYNIKPPKDLNHNLIHFISSSPASAAYMRQWTGSSLVQVMACRLLDAKPIPEPMLTYRKLDP